MKKFLSVISALLIVLFVCGCAQEESYPKPSEKFFVNDFAQVIDADDEEKIFNNAKNLQEQTTAQVVVVTLKSLNDEEISEYALNLGREWGVGSEEKDNGIVILLSTEQREIYISVGYGLEGALPDSKTGRIIDTYGIDYLKNNDFSKGLLAISNAIVNEVFIEYGITPNENYTPIDSIPEKQPQTSAKKVISSWIILIILVFIYLFLFRRTGFIWFGGPRPPFSSGSFRGGGFGGGGGFRGGGGSFGGGGAGRGF